MDFLLPSKEVKQKVMEEVGLNEQRVKETVKGLREWLELQPHLPKEDSESICNYS